MFDRCRGRPEDEKLGLQTSTMAQFWVSLNSELSQGRRCPSKGEAGVTAVNAARSEQVIICLLKFLKYFEYFLHQPEIKQSRTTLRIYFCFKNTQHPAAKQGGELVNFMYGILSSALLVVLLHRPTHPLPPKDLFAFLNSTPKPLRFCSFLIGAYPFLYLGFSSMFP